MLTQAQIATAMKAAAPYLGMIPGAGLEIEGVDLAVEAVLEDDPELFQQIQAAWVNLEPFLAHLDAKAFLGALPSVIIALAAQMQVRAAQPEDPAQARVDGPGVGSSYGKR